MKSEWFDEWGNLIKEIPEEAVADCSHQGECFPGVEYWQAKLDFMGPRQQMLEYLYPFGGWEREELNGMTDVELAQIVLWIAAGDIQENGEWFGLIH